MNYNTTSISKGCFVFNENRLLADAPNSGHSVRRGQKSHFRRYLNAINEQPFFQAYRDTWTHLKADIDQLQNESQSQLLDDIIGYILNNDQAAQNQRTRLLPTVAVLTGVNQPDHLEQFMTLGQNIQKRTTGHVCLLPAQHCSTVKSALENLVYNFIHQVSGREVIGSSRKTLKRSQCTMRQLKNWFNKRHWPKYPPTNDNHSSLVVILPDFECYPQSVLQDLLQILSRYCQELPFVLIMGVATSIAALYETLPHHVTCHLQLRIYEAKLAPIRLNEIVENVLLSGKYAFRLSGRVLKFLSHIFLNYDFSINGFIQTYKCCLLEHFFQGNIFALCCTMNDETMEAIISNFTDEDYEDIRQQLSFRPYIESLTDPREVIALLSDNKSLMKKLPKLLRDCHQFFMLFRIFMEFLYVLLEDLPKGNLAKNRLDLYVQLSSMNEDITENSEFKNCWQLLSFMSRETFLERIMGALNATRSLQKREMFPNEELSLSCNKIIHEKLSKIEELLEKMQQSKPNNVSSDDSLDKSLDESPPPPPPDQFAGITSRAELKSKLLEMTKSQKSNSTKTMADSSSIDEVLKCIRDDIIRTHLLPFTNAPPLHELFVFTNLGMIRQNTIGAPRASLHLALNDPQYYLQCECCDLEENEEQIKRTLPDIGIMYKLHLECGRLINLFDWLQSFDSIVVGEKTEEEANGDSKEPNINPLIQARFTYAMAELQFLGFIKMSRTKTDHANRLTW